MHHRSTHNSDPLTELKREAETMKDPEHKNITEHMIVVMAALEVGANVDRLVKRTGYNRKFVEGIELRMRKAGLWVGELVDDRELDQDSELLYGIFRHALVAQGTGTRIPNMNGGCVYLDVETGDVSGEWSPKGTDIISTQPKAIKTMTLGRYSRNCRNLHPEVLRTGGEIHAK